MKVIRLLCFETNSSSDHSILVTKNDAHITSRDLTADYDDDDYNQQEHIYVDSNGEIWLYGINHGYGRSPFEFLTSFEQKLKYAMCEFLGYKWGDDEDYDEIYQQFIDITKDLIPNFKDFDISTKEVDIYVDADGNELRHSQLKYDHWDEDKRCSVFTYVSNDGTAKEAILSDEVYEVPAIGTIDHQSSGLLTNFLKEKNVSLKEFLTNKKYAIIVTGDEYSTWPDMKNSGLIDKDFIIEEYTTSNDDIKYEEWLKEQEGG